MTPSFQLPLLFFSSPVSLASPPPRPSQIHNMEWKREETAGSKTTSAASLHHVMHCPPIAALWRGCRLAVAQDVAPVYLNSSVLKLKAEEPIAGAQEAQLIQEWEGRSTGGPSLVRSTNLPNSEVKSIPQPAQAISENFRHLCSEGRTFLLFFRLTLLAHCSMAPIFVACELAKLQYGTLRVCFYFQLIRNMSKLHVSADCPLPSDNLEDKHSEREGVRLPRGLAVVDVHQK